VQTDAAEWSENVLCLLKRKKDECVFFRKLLWRFAVVFGRAFPLVVNCLSTSSLPRRGDLTVVVAVVEVLSTVKLVGVEGVDERVAIHNDQEVVRGKHLYT
jgi:hypothetical protein